jgi:hypothetical protein
MKKLLAVASFLLMSAIGFSQTCPTPTTTGVFVTLDSNYQLAPSAAGFTNVGLCFYNNTTTLITAAQFRVYYDKLAFSGVDTVTSLNTSYSQYLQYVDNPANGYVTITLSYTGSLSTFEIPDGAFVQLKLQHITGFSSLTSVGNMSFSGVNTYPSISTRQDGTDNTLTLQNFGGVMLPQTFSFTGTFTNVTGTGAKDLTVGLEKKLRPSGSWTPVTSTLTNTSGVFAFNDIAVDTTGYDVRIKIVGDTMSVGNVISTADAQKVNDYVLGTQTPTGFDYYAADVNGDNNITISDAYGVFGRISGRFSVWPNSVKDVKFFTSAEYTTINGSSTNYLSSIPGTTNFTFNIIAGAPSPTFYVLVPGDANGTGYHMARVTPIEVLINPQPGVESQIYNVIDNRVEYDFPTTSIEVNVPRLSVQEGNLVNIPVKVFTSGTELGSLQFGLKYNDTLLEFKGIDSKSSASSWLTYLNTNDNIITWGGYDNSNHLKPIRNNDEVVTLKFIAKQPQNLWDESPLWTTDKFAGDNQCKDLEITPTNGIVQVYKMVNGHMTDVNGMIVYPNPTEDYVTVKFEVKEYGNVRLSVYGVDGKEYKVMVNDKMPQGDYQYSTNLGYLPSGVYMAVLKRSDIQLTSKIILK